MAASEIITGKWERLDDGTFGGSVRMGGRGSELVGRTVQLRSKGHDMATVTVTEVVRDYGTGDVVVVRIARASS